MGNNIIRQIVDIQAQAERLIRTNAGLVEIEQFARYNDELRTFLVENVKDDFVLKYVKEIPNLDIEETEIKTGLTALIIILISSFSGGAALYHEKRQAQKALNAIRDIKGKYASAEFMLKNYFANE